MRPTSRGPVAETATTFGAVGDAPRGSDSGSPRLLLRFAVFTFLAVAIATFGAFLLIQRRVTRQSERGVDVQARIISGSVLNAALRPGDVSQPVSRARRAVLDGLLRGHLGDFGARRVNVWSPTGLLVYSTSHELIGTRSDDLDNLEEALSGRPALHVSRLNAESGSGSSAKVLEAYVAFRSGAAARPAGVLEVYKDYGIVLRDTRDTLVPVTIVLVLAALGLYLMLFPILRRVTSTLRERSRRLAHQTHELRASEARLRLLLEQLPALLLTTDDRLRVTSAAGRALAELPAPPAGAALADLFAGAEEHVLAHRRALRGESVPCEFEWSGRALTGRIDPLRDDHGEIVGTLCLAIDTTAEREAQAERVRLEEELHQSQKVEAVGQLAAGIAHDFNNVLTGIRGYSDLLHSELSERDDPLVAYSEQIVAATQRARSLTGRLLAFSRREPISARVVDLNEIVRHASRLLARTLGEQIEVEDDLAAESLWVEGDSSQLEQAVVNLSLNARDAMARGGRLTIATGSGDAPASAAARPEGMPEGDFAWVSVRDTGVGMSDAVKARVFEPFFTTKPAGIGTGLGLASVWRTAKQAHGHVLLESEEGRGTTVTILLPVVEAPRPAPADAGERRGVAPGCATILVVDDDPGVRDLTAQALRAHGYRTLEAHDGDAAIALTDGEWPDLLLTDVVLPGRSGSRIATTLRSSDPALPVIYMSGYTDDVLVRHGVDQEGMLFLEKPFSVDDLIAAVSDALRGRADAAAPPVAAAPAGGGDPTTLNQRISLMPEEALP